MKLLVADALASPFGGPYSLDIERGECVCILGRSGSGKSVLLRLIADLDPGTGTVTLDGKRRERFAPPDWRRHVVYQAAEPAWWAATPARHFPDPANDEVAQGMRALGLEPALLDGDLSRMSTGERQRLALIRSLVRHPAVLLLDEPAASLDHASTLAMETLLRARLQSGLGILMVTHSREQAERIGSRRFEMVGGRLQVA